MGFRFTSFIRFLIKSKNQHGVHSPFVYDFVCQCLYNRKKTKYEQELKKLYQKDSQFDFSYKKLKLLIRIIDYFKVKTFVDLSLTNGRLSQIVEISNRAEIYYLKDENGPFLSQDNRQSIDYKKIRPKKSNSLYFIGRKLSISSKKKYIHSILSKSSTDSILILDGIHSDAEDESFWEELKSDPKIKVSVDLFFWGIIFLKQDQVKEHFRIRAFRI